MRSLRPARRSLLLIAAWSLVAAGAAAQEVIDPIVDLDFERPESWAMAYFTSAGLFTSLGVNEPRPAGSFQLGAEVIWVPELDEEQRRVGYGGFKEEDINRSPVWARLRARVSLPAGFALEAGWIPPVEIDGVEANLVSLALDRRIFTVEPWSLGLRVHAQRGTAEGDFTCRAGGDHLFPPGSPQNAFGCEAPSADEVELNYWGGELLLGHQRQAEGAAFFAGLSYNRLDTQFQVNALTFGFLDRTLLRSEGDTLTWMLGADLPLGGPFRLALAAQYTQLEILRPGQDLEDDSLLHLRAQIAWRWR